MMEGPKLPIWSPILPALALGLALAVTGAACGDDRQVDPPVPQATKLEATPDTILLLPGQGRTTGFRLTDMAGQPLGGERLELAIVDDGPDGESRPAGATLSASSALTDADGVARVQVTGGLPTKFEIAARHQRALSVETTVIVGNSPHGYVTIVPAVIEAAAALALTTVDLLLYDDRRCVDLPLVPPNQPTRPVRTAAPGAGVDFAVYTGVVSAVIGRGRGAAGKLLAVGCVDVPGSAAAAGDKLRIDLPLGPLTLVPAGAFGVASRLDLENARELTDRLAVPWQELGDCPLDPAERWLDCAVDALGGSTADLLDCVPSPAGEGALGAAVAARRGAKAAGSSCRGATTAAGASSLDAKLGALFTGATAAWPLVYLRELGTDAAALLDDVILESTLAFTATDRGDAFLATHTLAALSFRLRGEWASSSAVALGIPAAEARFVPAAAAGDRLALGEHGLTLRLGTLMRAAFADGALASRGLPRQPAALLEAVFAKATMDAGGGVRRSGCDAMDAVVCADIGQAAGCFRDACVAGQAALANQLDQAFATADGGGLDLVLSGSAVMIDDHGDGLASRLGDTESGRPGLWTAELRTVAGTRIVGGSWTALRNAPATQP
jgi:hypothetical protein